MRSITVHVPVAVGYSSVGEKESELMSALRSQAEKIPEHICVFQVRTRIALLSVKKGEEQNRVSNEENGRVVPHEVPNAWKSDAKYKHFVLDCGLRDGKHKMLADRETCYRCSR